MTDQDSNEIEKSMQGIREIDDLLNSPSFQAYAAKVEEKAAEMAGTVLHDAMPAQDREDIRLKRMGLLLGLRMLTNDREGHALNLRRHGIDV